MFAFPGAAAYCCDDRHIRIIARAYSFKSLDEEKLQRVTIQATEEVYEENVYHKTWSVHPVQYYVVLHNGKDAKNEKAASEKL